MKIEFILIGVIVLVFLIDFIVKRRKKGLIIPKQKTQFSKKKKIVLIISLLSTIVSSLLIYTYNPFFVINENNISIIDLIKYDRFSIYDVIMKNENNELTFVSKKTMEPITGIIFGEYENNGISINGQANGIFTIYNGARFKDDRYFEKSNYSNGKLDGLSQVWDSRSKRRLKKEANYKNGLRNGSFKYWSKGQLWLEENYINDILNGSYRKFDSNGEILAKGNYANGLKEGYWIEFYGDKVESRGDYLNGKKDGFWSFLHLKKEKEIILNFKNGLFVSGENLNEVEFYFTPPDNFDSVKFSYQELISKTLESNISLSQLFSKNDFEMFFYGVDITDLFY